MKARKASACILNVGKITRRVFCDQHGADQPATELAPNSIMCVKCVHDSYEEYAKKNNIEFKRHGDGSVEFIRDVADIEWSQVLQKGINEKPVTKAVLPASMQDSVEKMGLV